MVGTRWRRRLRPSRTIAVLGMHRSGTSALAGTLEQAGVVLGPVTTFDPFNAKGSREDRRVWTVNEAVLSANGATWRHPAPVTVWGDEHRALRNEIIASHRRDRRWGFKDPRTLLTVEFWLEGLPDLELVGTFRHPALVAESLLERNGESRGRWIDLWATYNARLVSLYEREPFPVVDFDREDGAYDAALRAALDRLSLPAREPLTFFDRSLRHHRYPAEIELPAPVRALYERLCAIAV